MFGFLPLTFADDATFAADHAGEAERIAAPVAVLAPRGRPWRILRLSGVLAAFVFDDAEEAHAGTAPHLPRTDVLHESEDLAGAVLDSGVLDVRAYAALGVYALNGTTGARNLLAHAVTPKGAAIEAVAPVAVAAGATVRQSWGLGGSIVTPPGPLVRVRLAAGAGVAGTENKLFIVGRR